MKLYTLVLHGLHRFNIAPFWFVIYLIVLLAFLSCVGQAVFTGEKMADVWSQNDNE